MEGQINGGYFLDYILDPSVIDCSRESTGDLLHLGLLPHGVYLGLGEAVQHLGHLQAARHHAGLYPTWNHSTKFC